MREIKVIKKDGRVEGFDINKIFNAVSISASRVKKELSLENKKKLESLVHMELDNRINGDEGITVEELHFIVQLALNQIDKAIYVEYRNYKSYKTKLNMSFDNIYRRSKKLLFMSEEEKENANKNSALNSTQKGLLGSIMCKELLNYELTDEMKAARDDGGLYYHDEDDRIIMSHNCNIFNMANTLKDGFIMDGIKLKEASDFKTACRHVSNITINASSCQYGGFTIDIVTALAPFVQKTRNKFRKKYETFPLTNDFKEKQVELDTKEEVYESIKNLQYECNLIQNAQAQTTFLTWGLRLWGTEDEKLIVRATLETRMNKMGEDRIDFIFPKLSMASHRKLNDEDLFDLAVRCSAKCLYPDWLSVESGYLGDVFERTGKIIYGMGCLDGQELITYKIDEQLYVEAFERMWNRLEKLNTVKMQPNNIDFYMDLYNVKIYDTKRGFVNVKRIIKNNDKHNWVRVKFSNGRSILATEDHPLPILNKGRTFVKDLNIGDKIVINQNQYSEFNKEFDEDLAWFYGFMLCDGCYDRQFSMSIAAQDEDDIEERYKTILLSKLGLSSETIKWNRGKRGTYKEVRARDYSSKEIQDKFTALFGGLQKKYRQIPNEVFSWNKEAKLSFLAGMIDADGYVNSTGHCGAVVQIGSTNKELALQTMALVQSLGYPSKLYLNHYTSKDRNKIRYRVEFSATLELLGYMSCQKKIDCFNKEANITNVNTSCVTNIEKLGFLNKFSYDVMTESDHFEASGIYSHNCRAYLSPFVNPYTGEEIYEGRANIGAISIMLPELAMRVKKGDIDGFLKEYDKYFEIALKTHEYFYEKIGKKKASSNPLFFCEGGCWIKLKPTDTCEKAVQGFTASFGYIGLHETSLILTGKPLHQNIEFGERIMKHMADKVEEAKKRTGHLYALYSSPSEGLCDKHRNFLYEKYGYIEGVTDKEWITNSFHIDVKTPISALEKIDIESKFFDYAKGGRIVYTEWSHTENIQALKDIITYAMRKGLYMGINFENGTCFDCKHQGDFSNTHVCPNCGSSNITVIDRVCGYLGFRKQNGKTRYNNGKDNETVERVKHYNIDAEEVV